MDDMSEIGLIKEALRYKIWSLINKSAPDEEIEAYQKIYTKWLDKEPEYCFNGNHPRTDYGICLEDGGLAG